MSQPRCRIVVPLFNDVDSFLPLREEVLATCGSSPDVPDDLAFVVIDDSGGRDPEVDLLKQLPDVTVITPPFNLGHQRAITVGLRAIAPALRDDDVVVTMDGDGEDKPEDVPRLVARLRQADDWSVVIARRTRRQVTLRFRILYLGFVFIFRALTGRTIRSGNFAAFRGAYVRTMLPHPSFDLCYSSTLLALERSPILVPCARGQRTAGRSRMGSLALLMHGVRMMMPLADRIAVRSLVLSAVLGAFTVTSLAVLTTLRVTGVLDATALGALIVVTLGIGTGLSLAVFLVLFTGFVQTSSLSMGRIHERVTIDG